MEHTQIPMDLGEAPEKKRNQGRKMKQGSPAGWKKPGKWYELSKGTPVAWYHWGGTVRFGKVGIAWTEKKERPVTLRGAEGGDAQPVVTIRPNIREGQERADLPFQLEDKGQVFVKQ